MTPVSYFHFFDLPVSFDIDTELLAQRYRNLQRLVHPDNFANATEHERLSALQKATYINEAFNTLKNPMARGRYLLELQGIKQDDTPGVMDSDFLMEQMELREELADIKEHPQPMVALNTFLQHMEQRMKKLTNTLSQQFAQGRWQAARENIKRFQFFKKLHEEALSLEEELV